MRRESKAERAAWTEFVQGADSDPKANKYGAVRKNGYASKHEADAAAKYQLLASRGIIREYQEQFRITLVPGNGKLRPVVYVADFKYIDDDGLHIVDTKSVFTAKLPVYRLKKRLAALILCNESRNRLTQFQANEQFWINEVRASLKEEAKKERADVRS